MNKERPEDDCCESCGGDFLNKPLNCVFFKPTGLWPQEWKWLCDECANDLIDGINLEVSP